MSAHLARFEATRRSAILLMESLKDEEWDRIGIVNDYEGTALSWGCVIAGHAVHHLRVLEERYFGEQGLSRK
ncbi:hypothetical protein D3C87_2024850 [compost metagenome]